jgi:hypothetical protein
MSIYIYTYKHTYTRNHRHHHIIHTHTHTHTHTHSERERLVNKPPQLKKKTVKIKHIYTSNHRHHANIIDGNPPKQPPHPLSPPNIPLLVAIKGIQSRFEEWFPPK